MGSGLYLQQKNYRGLSIFGRANNLSTSVSKKWRESIFYEAANLLDREDRRKVVWVILLQISFGFLDLLGVMLIGVIGALAITGVSSGQQGNRVSSLLEFVGLED